MEPNHKSQLFDHLLNKWVEAKDITPAEEEPKGYPPTRTREEFDLQNGRRTYRIYELGEEE